MRKVDKTRWFKRPLLASAIATLIASPATADDLDVFNAVLASQIKPNVVFVLDYSGSMNRDVNGNKIAVDDTVTQSKVEILNDAVRALLADNAGKLNAGIGSIYKSKPSGVRWPVRDLEMDAHEIDPAIPPGQFTSADIISKQLERPSVTGSTPTVNALAEAAAYFKGGPVSHDGADINHLSSHRPDVWDPIENKYSGGNSFAAMPSSYAPRNAFQFDVDGSGYETCTNIDGGEQGCEGHTIISCESVAGSGDLSYDVDGNEIWSEPGYDSCKYEVAGSWITPYYESPITTQCQSNFIVLISDGSPTVLRDTPTLSSTLNDAGYASIDDCESLTPSIFPETDKNRNAGNCGPEILDYLANNDQNPDIAGSEVRTYTVGFATEGPSEQYLRRLASAGKGEFREATKPEELSAALTDIIDSILAGSQNFSELAVDVNADTFSHDDRTYFSLFSPRASNSWEGNLKGFFIDETGLLDIHGAPATFDDGTGLKFSSTSQSFWSSEVDGNEISLGGASESISTLPPGPNARNMYTYIDGNSTFLATDDDNLLINVSEDLMGNPGEATRDSALQWLANAPMGDPLHSKPVVANYGTDKRVIYVMTNQGFLHAFDASTPLTTNSDMSGGEEIFAFMPQELIPNIPALATPATTAGDHIYGLDGGLTKWHTDLNNNGKVDGGDSMLLVFGMRRGGSNYYAIDVTDPENPEFKWQISPDEPKFSDLAQSWSRPTLINVNHGGVEKRVLMFAGGYDADTVDGTTKSTKAAGNAVYMVDENGKHVWSIGKLNHANNHGKLEYSIPSDLTVIDADNNGVADRVYFGDLGGQMWRVDFDDVSSSADTTITLFADVTENANDHQPIFYKPSVSLNREDGELFLAIAFGTGNRTDPLNPDSQNAFYMLRDKNYKVGPPLTHPSNTILPVKIADLTENPIGSTDDDVREAAQAELADKSGWKVSLDRSEKSLSAVTTFEGKFLATTFEPSSDTNASGEVDPCSFSTHGRLYIMDILDATPIQILSDGSELTNGEDKNNRVIVLNSTAIPSSPLIRFPADSSKVQLIVDKESVVTINRQLRTVYWHAK